MVKSAIRIYLLRWGRGYALLLGRMVMISTVETWLRPGPPAPLSTALVGYAATLLPFPLALWSLARPRAAGWLLLLPLPFALLQFAGGAGPGCASSGLEFDLIIIGTFYCLGPLALLLATWERGGKANTGTNPPVLSSAAPNHPAGQA